MKTKFKIGDLIITYHSGIHSITNIEIREGLSPLLTYKKVIQENGEFPKPHNAKENQCDEGFCILATEYIASEEQRISNIKEKTKQLKNENA